MRNCLCMLLMLTSLHSYSQYGRYKGAEYVQVQAGFTDAGLMGSIMYIHNYEHALAIEVGVGASHARLADVILTTVFVDGAGSFCFYNRGRVFYLSLTAGLTLAADILNDFPSERLDQGSFLAYGLLGGLESEFKVLRTVSVILSGSQRYYMRPTFDKSSQWRFNAGVGVRISL